MPQWPVPILGDYGSLIFMAKAWSRDMTDFLFLVKNKAFAFSVLTIRGGVCKSEKGNVDMGYLDSRLT